jgi:DUF971 family protein
MTNAWPKELRVSKDRRSLTIAFDTGESYTLSAELLRVASPSAEVQGHSPEQRVTVPGKMNVEIAKMDPVGSASGSTAMPASAASSSARSRRIRSSMVRAPV